MRLGRQKKQLYLCSFCGKDQDQVQRLIAGPHYVYVCNECVIRMSRIPEVLQKERGLLCSFCGKSQEQVQDLSVGPHGVNICSECLALCQEIMAEAAHQQE